MPVMEGKAMLFKEFAGVDAFPICLDTKDTDEIVARGRARSRRPSAASTSRTSPLRAASRSRTASRRRWTSPSSTTTSTAPPSSCSPRCSTRSRSPASASRTSRVLVIGLGAAGVAVTQDPARGRRRPRSSAATRAARCTPGASTTSTGRCRRSSAGTPSTRTSRGAHGPPGRRHRRHGPGRRACPAPASCPAEALQRMNDDAMVFAMANPNPEISPEEAAPVRADHGHRPLGLPEPDQQRPLLPGHLPRRAGRARARDHRGHEDGRRARRSPRSCPRTSCARTTSSPRCSTATWPTPSPHAVAVEAKVTGVAETEEVPGFVEHDTATHSVVGGP